MNHPGFEQQNPFAKNTASRTFSLTNDPLNYRRLFIESLFIHTKGLNYGLLNPFRSVSELFNLSQMEFFILQEELPEWTEICKNSSYVSKVHITSVPGGHKFLLKFFDHATLELKLISSLSVQGLLFAEVENYINDALIDRDGVKRISRKHNFEYNFIRTCFSGQIFSKETGLYLLSASPEDQREILAYFAEKYGIVVPNMIRLMSNVFLYKEIIEEVLRIIPQNTKKTGTNFLKKYSRA
ncbi:MAG: hypothetical protein R3D00_01630 [Bacteroidia bacterium]